MKIEELARLMEMLKRPVSWKVHAHDSGEFAHAIAAAARWESCPNEVKFAHDLLSGFPIYEARFLEDGTAIVIDGHGSIVRVINYKQTPLQRYT